MHAKAANGCPGAAANRKSPLLCCSTLWTPPDSTHKSVQSFRLLVLFPRPECQGQRFLQDRFPGANSV
jgi:hypothetical protein